MKALLFLRKIVLIILGLALVAFVGFKAKALLAERKVEIKEEPLPQKTSVSVKVVHAKEGTVESKQNFLAQISSDKSIKVSTKMAGYIQKIYVQESQRVHKGQTLVTIDNRDLASNIALLKTSLLQQKNDLALAQQIYNRNQKLYEIGGLAREQVDISRVAMQGKETAINSTHQKIAQLQNQSSYLEIKAPFNGEIDSIMQYEGDLASAGRPILTMSNGTKKLIFSYTPNNQESIRRGQKVYLEHQEIGSVKTIRTQAKQGLVQAEVALNKPLNLPLGSSLTISVKTKERRGCLVPNNTILHRADGEYLMSYEKSKFSPFKIRTIMSQKDEVMVEPCPPNPIAQASEVKLSVLPSYGEVEISE